MRLDQSVIALSLLAAAEAAHSFSSYLPSYFTIRTLALDGDEQQVKTKLENLRSGYRPAITFGLLLGGIVSVLAKSPLPILFSIGTSALMVSQYEAALPKGRRLTGSQVGAYVLDLGPGLMLDGLAA